MEVRHKILPKQKQFVRSVNREVLYSGAFGAGKTRALCFKLVMRACIPGAREFLCRKTNVDLKASTLHTLLRPDGILPPVLPEGSYVHQKANQVILIRDGGEIIYRGLDMASKIGSIQLTGASVDEGVEISEDSYTMLRGRIRVNVPGLVNQINVVCNPGSPSHFLAKRFGLDPGGTAEPGCEAICTNTAENPYLPQDYIDDLSKLTGVAKKRFYYGKWVGSDGLVYDNWNRETHVKKRRRVDWKYSILAIDDGYSNPFAVILLQVDGDGRIHVGKEFYKTKLINSEKIEIIKSFMGGKNNTTAVLIDPSAAEFREELIRKNIPAQPASNSVFSGIVAVQAKLKTLDDGKPGLTVDPNCINTIREFESYEWGNTVHGLKDEPRKLDDHAMDAIRYGINYIDVYGGDAFKIIKV